MSNSELGHRMSPIDEQLQTSGYADLGVTDPAESTLQVAKRTAAAIGAIVSTSVEQSNVTRLGVKSPNTYGGNYGCGELPLHSDLAHWYRPPRYVLLRCITGSSKVSTRLLDRYALEQFIPRVLDGKDWNNALFALGKKGLTGKLSPKSIDATEVISRLESLLPDFNRELANFCALHLQRRNGELHSGALPFDELNTSTWLPQFYAACSILLTAQDSSLKDVFGDDEAKTAFTLIEAIKDEAAKSVKGTINAHKTIWEEKSIQEREKLAKQAETTALRAHGHRVNCPSCDSVALLHGSPAGAESSTYKDGLIVNRQPMLPSTFECKACGLKIVGYSKLNACGLGGTFTSTSYTDPIDYFEDDFRDRFSGMDDDNNEP